jgi:hypothetical protein
MSISRRSAVALVTLAALTVGACDSLVPSPSPSPSPSALPSPSPDPEALVAEITAQVEAIRGLQADGPIPVEILDQDGLAEHQREQFQEDNPPELISASEGLLKRLGLLAPDQSLEDLYLELLETQVLGFYDDESGTLYVVSRDGDISALERFTMSHEIDHALQDQAFDLSVVVPDPTNEGDAAIAALSLVEGDASLLMVQWATEHLTPAELLEVVESATDDEQTALLESMPAILSGTLQFPYITGLEFVLGPQTQGGWSAVDAMYDDPPVSTEQVLHPDTYAAGEDPVDVVMPDGLVEAMGAGWSLGLEDTFGEYQLSIWLAESGNAEAVATRAAAGWGGDRMAYLTGPDGADALVWRTEWDSEDDAAQFATAALTAVGGLGDADVLGVPEGTERWVILASDPAALDLAIAAAGLEA